MAEDHARYPIGFLRSLCGSEHLNSQDLHPSIRHLHRHSDSLALSGSCFPIVYHRKSISNPQSLFQIHDYAIGEVHSFLLVVSASNVYLLIRMVLAGVHIYDNR